MSTPQETAKKIRELKTTLNERRLRWDFADERLRERMEILESILMDYMNGARAEPGGD